METIQWRREEGGVARDRQSASERSRTRTDGERSRRSEETTGNSGDVNRDRHSEKRTRADGERRRRDERTDGNSGRIAKGRNQSR